MRKTGYWERVARVIQNADIILEVLDARFAHEMRNPALKSLIERYHKKHGILLNKSDLSSRRQVQAAQSLIRTEVPVMSISAKTRKGKMRLKTFIHRLAGQKTCTVAFVGYPNCGKSSLINFLCGRHSAKTSSIAGFTRGEQRVRASENLFVLDSPGILPFTQLPEEKLMLFGAFNPQSAQDIESCALYLIEFLQKNNPQKLKELIGFTPEGTDPEAILEESAIRKKKLVRGGTPDTQTTARLLCTQWVQGK
ncbi:MAG: 50S ribosome-binding GTPase [Candidatus Diapherotrites archaeon]|nr:50S ribosome-binding GTPase [Candidatus Diapherotrites archaeon]